MVVHEPQTLNPVRGTRLELTCDITTTNPNIRLTWLKNGVPVQSSADGRIQFQNYNQLLLFDPVVPGDDGKYTCQANDPMKTSVSTYVKVHERGVLFQLYPFKSRNDINYMIKKEIYFN